MLRKIYEKLIAIRTKLQLIRKSMKPIVDMENKEAKILYLCDCKDDDCSKTGCYKTIGDCKTACKHTVDIRHAKNFYNPNTDLSFFVEKEPESKVIGAKIKLEGEKEYKEAINSAKNSIIEFRQEIEQLNTALEKEIELLKKLR